MMSKPNLMSKTSASYDDALSLSLMQQAISLDLSMIAAKAVP
jgi:hypothetical protein